MSIHRVSFLGTAPRFSSQTKSVASAGVSEEVALTDQVSTLSPLSKAQTQALSDIIRSVYLGAPRKAVLPRLRQLDPGRAALLDEILFAPPRVERHEGVFVVRDDRLPGGTKSRFFVHLFSQHDHVVYPSTTWGGAQVALAAMARLTGKHVTLFVAKRQQLHPRTLEAIRLGGPHVTVKQVPHGFLNVLESHAKRFSTAAPGRHYLEVGGKSSLAESVLARVIKQVEDQVGPIDELWSAAASGVLTRGLQAGLKNPKTKIIGVQVGMDIADPGRAKIIRHPKRLEQELRMATPFPSCANYDRKAWELCRDRHGAGTVVFWNVLGPSNNPSREPKRTRSDG